MFSAAVFNTKVSFATHFLCASGKFNRKVEYILNIQDRYEMLQKYQCLQQPNVNANGIEEYKAYRVHL